MDTAFKFNVVISLMRPLYSSSYAYRRWPPAFIYLVPYMYILFTISIFIIVTFIYSIHIFVTMSIFFVYEKYEIVFCLFCISISM